MTWRTVYISNNSHLSFKNNYVVIRNENIKQVHISEINTLIIDSNMSTISTYLLNELVRNNVKVIFCNEKHNPNMELMPYSCSFESSRMIIKQLSWNYEHRDRLWKQIIMQKISKQSNLLKKYKKSEFIKLQEYVSEVEDGDSSNREGHAAKVYFNALFGCSFSRNSNDNINAFLDYGYTILMSMFNRAIVSHGYLTQIGIHHKGPTNPFNLACDLMEPFRPIVDDYAVEHLGDEFSKDNKLDLVNLINKKIIYMQKEYYFHNAVDLYINNVLSSFDSEKIEQDWLIYDEK